MAKTLIILLTFLITGWFLFTYKLTDIPPGINGDEAVIGYLSSLISKTGYDAQGKFLPLFTNVSWPDWKQPVTIYSTVAAFKIFGVSYFNLRAVSVFFTLVSGTIIFFLLKEIFDKRFALLGLLLFITIPILMIQSHLAIENIAPVPYVSFWLWMMAKYTKKKSNKYLFFSALALGVSIYSYLGLRLIAPVLSLLSIGYIIFLNNFKKSTRPLIIFILGLIPFIILALAVKNEYPGAILAANKPESTMSYQQFLMPYISSFDLSFLFLKGDSTPYHSTGKQGMFLLATLPLFLLGLFKIAGERKPFFILTLLAFFFTPVLFGLPNSIYRASRLLVLIPPFIIISTLGFKYFSEIKKAWIRQLISLVILIAVVLNYRDFVLDYWFDYSNRVSQNFEKPIQKVFEQASDISKKEGLDIFIQSDVQKRNIPVYTFFEQAYFSKNAKIWSEGEDLPARSIIMVSSHILQSIKKPDSVEFVDNKDLDLNLLINK